MTSYSKITIAGSEIYPDNVLINKTLGENNSSSTFQANLNNYTGKLTGSYSIGDEVKIYCDKDTDPPTTQIFLGIVEDINLKGKGLNESMILSGRDYSARLMDRTVEPEAYNNLPAGSIVKDIITKYTDDITTNNVSDGEVIERIVFNHTPVFDAINQLSQLTNYMFYVDNSKDLHFKEPSTVESGYTFGSGGIPITKSSFKQKRKEIFNDVWVYGDRYLDGYQESFVGDGTGSVFTLGYKPSNTTITVDGNIVQPGGIYELTYQAGSNVKYLVNYSDRQIIFTSGTIFGDNIPGAGSQIIVDYMRDLPIVKHGDNDASISSYGRKVKVIQDTSIKDPVSAEKIMLQELSEWSDPLKEGKFELQNIANITVGETCIVNIPFYDINSTQYDIIQANYNINKDNLLKDKVLEIITNKKIDDVTDTLKELILSQKRLQGQNISTTDLLTRYKISSGSIGIRQSGIEIWTQGIGSSFILGHPVNGLIGSYYSHSLGSFKTGSTLNWSGGYF